MLINRIITAVAAIFVVVISLSISVIVALPVSRRPRPVRMSSHRPLPDSWLAWRRGSVAESGRAPVPTHRAMSVSESSEPADSSPSPISPPLDHRGPRPTTSPNHHQQQHLTTTSLHSHRSPRSALLSPFDTHLLEAHLEEHQDTFTLGSHNSKGNITVLPDGRLSAPRAYHHSTGTVLRLVKSKFSGYGLVSGNETSPRFVCFDQETGNFVAKGCFDWCHCSFSEAFRNNYLEYHLVSNEGLKLSFNKKGNALECHQLHHPNKRKLRRSFQFLKHKVNSEAEESGGQWSLPSRAKYVEDISTAEACSWSRTGETIFEPEIRQDPMLECALTRHNRASCPERVKKLNKKKNKVKSSLASAKTTAETNRVQQMQKFRQQLQVPWPEEDGIERPQPIRTKRSEEKRRVLLEYFANFDTTTKQQETERRKIRHANKKVRSLAPPR